MNKVILIGNLTRDLEVRHSKDGLIIANSSLAINEFKGTEKEKTIFIDFSLFGKNAENANKYLKKGSRVAIFGKLDFQSWISQGLSKNKHAVIVDEITFLDKREKQEDEVIYKEEVVQYEN
ncbi:single-stranded DNA-binding protein [Aliarcobacter thereius]|uniref:Single-stranded DNA-binding protein n=1 Tax=Aliarcobacter thereius TaxID=544718 RepID=A0A5R9GZ56_9BACT|nr:single-stranded DNA-binding protein [Aliarcobacter thereius]TLS71049.1 single-stranded DNA-binding protein [Aliarcobacter thereius]TLT06653.1 single-stranded DNA-binding protein [Aliarcobacter thereius]